MQVHYIFHSGFLVETQQSYYIFDYFKGELPALSPQKPVIVFASHGHRDHYNAEIFHILRRMGMQDVYAVLAKDIPQSQYPQGVEVLKAYAGKRYGLPHGEQLETLLSTDKGVAYLLTSEAGAIYHGGDLNDWTWAEESEKSNRQMRGCYRHQIDKLRGRQIDIAFLPLDPRQEMHYAEGMRYFLGTVDVQRAYPMHYWEQPDVIKRFVQEYPQYEGIVQYTET